MSMFQINERTETSQGGIEGRRAPFHRVQRLVAGALLFFVSGIPLTHAEFNLNFTPDDGTYVSNYAYVSCGMSYIANANCNAGGGMFGDFQLAGSHDDGTAFYQRMFDDTAGNRYYQVIIGDYLVDDFVQEYIIKADGAADGDWYCCFGGGAVARSASAGDSADREYNMTRPYDVDGSLSTSTGTGSGNPNRVIMRQILTDNVQTDMLFLKDRFDYKPLISQTTQDADFTSYIELDMRNRLNSDPNPIDPYTEMVHTTTLLNAGVPHDGGDYDFSKRAETTYFTAGGYTYTDGTNYGGSLGTYTYMDAGMGDEFQPTNKDYSSFCDPAQNTDWSGNGACTNADGTGGGFGWGGGGGMMGW